MKRYIKSNENTELLGEDYIAIWNDIYNIISEHGGMCREVVQYMNRVVAQGIMSEADVQAIKSDALNTYYL